MSFGPGPKITITGPIAPDGSVDGPETKLYLVETATASAETDTNQEDIPTQGDDEAVLSPITGQRSFSFSGAMTGLKAAMTDKYSDDPHTALVQYMIELESLVLELQGIGYKLEDDIRGITLIPDTNPDPNNDDERPRGLLFETVRWEHTNEEALRVEYTVEGKFTEGVQQTNHRGNNYITDKRNAADDTITDDAVTTIGGLSFYPGEVTDRMYERKIDLESQDLIHGEEIPNVGVIQSGVKGIYNLEGRVSRDQVPSLSDLSKQITRDIHGQEVTIEDSLRRRTFTGAISDSSTTIKQGQPNYLEYSLELTIGEIPASFK